MRYHWQISKVSKKCGWLAFSGAGKRLGESIEPGGAIGRGEGRRKHMNGLSCECACARGKYQWSRRITAGGDGLRLRLHLSLENGWSTSCLVCCWREAERAPAKRDVPQSARPVRADHDIRKSSSGISSVSSRPCWPVCVARSTSPSKSRPTPPCSRLL